MRSNVTVERKSSKSEEIAPNGHFLGEKRAWGNTQSTVSVENEIKFHRKCRMRILFQGPSPVCQMQVWLDSQSTERNIRFLQLCWISFYSTVTLDVTPAESAEASLFQAHISIPSDDNVVEQGDVEHFSGFD